MVIIIYIEVPQDTVVLEDVKKHSEVREKQNLLFLFLYLREEFIDELELSAILDNMLTIFFCLFRFNAFNQIRMITNLS